MVAEARVDLVQKIREKVRGERCPVCGKRPVAVLTVFWLAGEIEGMALICPEDGVYQWANKQKMSPEQCEAMDTAAKLMVKVGIRLPI